jgi:MATE family multidrug resistance protein
VAAVFQVLDAVNIVFRSALRGAKDVRTPAVIGVVIVWTCVPCAAWLLGERLGYGALGGWLGFVAETTLGAAAMAWRWRRAPFRPARARVLAPAPSPA